LEGHDLGRVAVDGEDGIQQEEPAQIGGLEEGGEIRGGWNGGGRNGVSGAVEEGEGQSSGGTSVVEAGELHGESAGGARGLGCRYGNGRGRDGDGLPRGGASECRGEDQRAGGGAGLKRRGDGLRISRSDGERDAAASRCECHGGVGRALEIEEDLSIASVGDSRAYLLDDDGFRAITDDQTWVNEVGRPLGLDEESLKNHPMRHVLTMAIGASAPLTVNYYSVPLKTGAMVLMCSDGLHGVVETRKLEQILRAGRNGDSLEDSCRKLIHAAKEAGGPDNITAVLVRKTA